MFKHLCLTSLLALSLLGLAACETKTKNLGDGSGDPTDMIETDRLGPNDLKALAQKIADDVKMSPRVIASPSAPAVVRISPFLNETDDSRFPMQELVDSVMNELTRTGKLEAISNDTAALEAYAMKQKLKGQSGVHMENYTLSGRVTRDEQTVGNKRQITYYVIFKVTNSDTGTDVLSSQAKRVKVQTRGTFGY